MKRISAGLLYLAAMTAVFFGCHSSPGIEASIAMGEKVYVKTCLPCHQAKGGGVPQLNPPLKNTPYVLGDAERLIGIVLNGSTAGVEINGERYSNPMPGFAATLTDQEIADVLTYVRNSFGNKAEGISAAEVKAVRK